MLILIFALNNMLSVSSVAEPTPFRMGGENRCFTITTEIHARSLVDFYCQYVDRHMNLKFMRRVSEREQEIRQFVIVNNWTDA